jgi:hypothetical protein
MLSQPMQVYECEECGGRLMGITCTQCGLVHDDECKLQFEDTHNPKYLVTFRKPRIDVNYFIKGTYNSLIFLPLSFPNAHELKVKTDARGLPRTHDDFSYELDKYAKEYRLTEKETDTLKSISISFLKEMKHRTQAFRRVFDFFYSQAVLKTMETRSPGARLCCRKIYELAMVYKSSIYELRDLLFVTVKGFPVPCKPELRHLVVELESTGRDRVVTIAMYIKTIYGAKSKEYAHFCGENRLIHKKL